MQAISEWNDPATQTLIVTHAGIIRIALAKGDEPGHFNAKVEFVSNRARLRMDRP